MTTKTTKKETTKTKRVKLTLQQRVELGTQAWDEFVAEQKARPHYEARMKKAGQELDLWIEITLMRERAGMTQIDVAKKLGLSQSTIAKLESKGHGGYTVDTLWKLAEATNHHLIIKFEPNNQHTHG